MSDYLYQQGSGLEVPGVEAVLEYGDASSYAHGAIPGALRVNDRSTPDQVHVTDLTGLHDDPDVGDSRTERAARWGERAGLLVPRGRTIGITGHVRSGNVARMRDLWRHMRGQFGRVERDLLVHPPGEVVSYVNQINANYLAGWTSGPNTFDLNISSSLASFSDGTMSGIAATYLIVSPTASTLFAQSALVVPWSGEDVWMTAIVRAPTQAAAVASISLAIDFVTASGARTTWIAAGTGTIATPVVGNYYLLSTRMTTASMPLSTVSGAVAVSPGVVMPISSSSGSYVLRVARAAAVLLRSGDVAPAGVLDAEMPGFEVDQTSLSRSYGPCYAVNQMADPDSSTATGWSNDSTSGATVDTAGDVVRLWPGGGARASAWTIHNPSTTSRTLAIRTSSTSPFVVGAGRRYRAHVRLLVGEAFVAGALQVVWIDQSGSTISTSTVGTFDPVSSGALALDVEVSGVVTAPGLALRAYMRIASTSTSIVSGQKLSMFVTAPRFVDVSEYDPGDVEISGAQDLEHGLSTYAPSRSGATLLLSPTGARRRIPRPFLLQRARALWDGKAPESQRNLLYRRDFTMSLRASDPRVYVLDQRHVQLRASGSSTLVSDTPLAFGVALPATASSNAPVGFTYEGATFDTSGLGTVWRRTSLGAPYQRDGVAMAWAETSPLGHPTTGYMGAVSLGRMYYSAGSITYTTPQVTVAGDCISGEGVDYDLFADSYIGSTWQYNYIGALIKRVSSSTWLEARYNSANNQVMNAAHPGTSPPFSLELWCSHTTTGSSGTTRLGAWDVPVSVVTSGDLKRLRAYMDGAGVIYVELWSNDPNFNDDGLISRQTFAMSSGLSAVVGSAVAGRAGAMTRLGRWDDGTHVGIEVSRMQRNYNTPYLAGFESIDYSSGLLMINCPVIGDADDVPLQLQLRGGIDTPTLTKINVDTGETSVLRLSGKFLESDPVTIDMDAGTIKSASGLDYFDRRVVGSRFFSLAPGVNIIAVQAVGWDTSAPAHVIATWRDALR